MNAILLTSTFRRHIFVANYLAQHCDLRGVWQETKTFIPERYASNADEEAIIRRHFDARDASEETHFAEHGELRLGPGAVERRVDAGGCSTIAEVEAMRALGPDVVLVFGTGLLREPLLDAFAGRIINLHLGLSPYYRGAGTNFWPLVNREPEYVGATIHYLDAGIDTGPIIAHARPELRADDGPHDVGNRAIVAAADALVRAAEAHIAGRVRPVPQSRPASPKLPSLKHPGAKAGGGRLYQRKDFSAAAVNRLYRNFETGMISEYLAHRAARDAAIALIEPEHPSTRSGSLGAGAA